MKNRWVKIVALVLVLALVAGIVAAGIFAALSSKPSVAGTYTASDGKTLTLAKDGSGTVTVQGQSLTVSYKAEGDVVKIFDPTGQEIDFSVAGKDLQAPDGALWKKQK